VAAGVNSTVALAQAVSERLAEDKIKLPPGSAVVPVPEFALPSGPFDSVDLLSWMGWMTAGPPTLAAEVLRSAGRWAWIRYRWALNDDLGLIRPTPDARSIRQHTRSMFSEAVGVGAAGFHGCHSLMPSGALAVVNLDDAIDPLLAAGVIRRRAGWGKKYPDYLIVRGMDGGPLELLAIECKGTVKNEKTAIGQLAAGVRQVLGVVSDLPMRRVVFATTLELDEKEPQVRCHAIEVGTEEGAAGEVVPESLREAVRDAALIRALRCAGRYEPAEREESFEIAGRSMVGRSVEISSDDTLLRAAVGVDREVLRALEAPRQRRHDLLATLDLGNLGRAGRPPRVETPELVRDQMVMRDGVGIRFEQVGRLRAPIGLE